jgi:uncharacterized protein (DUF2141 family)
MRRMFNHPPHTMQAHHSTSVRWKQLLLALACSALLGTAPFTVKAEEPVLVVHAAGFKNDTGHAIAHLFYRGDDVPKKPRQEVRADIRDGKAVLAIASLPPGEYAVIVFHDANDNGVVDHNFIGFPQEALGFSNAFKLSLTSGMPSFEKLRFLHGDATQTLEIQVQ